MLCGRGCLTRGCWHRWLSPALEATRPLHGVSNGARDQTRLNIYYGRSCPYSMILYRRTAIRMKWGQNEAPSSRNRAPCLACSRFG